MVVTQFWKSESKKVSELRESLPGTISKRCLPGSSGLAMCSLTWQPCKGIHPWNTHKHGVNIIISCQVFIFDIFPFAAPPPLPFSCAYSFSFCSHPFIVQELLDCNSEDVPWTVEGNGIHPDGENHVCSTQRHCRRFEPSCYQTVPILHLLAILGLVNNSLTWRYFFLVHINSTIQWSLSLPSLSPLPPPSLLYSLALLYNFKQLLLRLNTDYQNTLSRSIPT